MKLKGIELKGVYKVKYGDSWFAVYDDKGNPIYYETRDEYWIKREFDSQGNRVYFEDSDGDILDKRVKELTIEEIEELLGYKIKIKG